MTTEAQKRASAKYDAKNVVMLTLKLNRKTDADIIKELETQQNKSEFIKTAIRRVIIQKCA